MQVKPLPLLIPFSVDTWILDLRSLQGFPAPPQHKYESCPVKYANQALRPIP